jgi:sporulation protein YunB
MKKIRLKSKKRLKIKTKISIIILMIIIFIYFFLSYADKKIFPVLMQQAKIDSKKMAIVVIKNSLNDDVLSILEEDELFNVVQNNNGEVQTIDFNPVIVNKFLAKTTSIVSENLKKIENGKIDDISFINSEDYNIKNLKNGVISEIPMGIITNNVLLSNIGPKVPVKLNLIGNVVSSIETSVSNYGINSALLEIYAKVEVTEEVIIPFQTKRIKVQNNIPISIKIIQGTVPEYYNNGSLTKSSDIISLPIETTN